MEEINTAYISDLTIAALEHHGHRVELRDGVWMCSNASAAEAWLASPDCIPALKALKRAKLAEIRWEKESAGCTFSGVTIQTDRESRGNLTGAALRADMAIRNSTAYYVNWKTPNGFVTLDAATILAIAVAAETYVNACFVREGVLDATIEAMTSWTDIVNLDLTTDWPE